MVCLFVLGFYLGYKNGYARGYFDGYTPTEDEVAEHNTEWHR